MKSPFPGMDPYLEQFWPDIHASLIIYSRDQIEEQLPGDLIARVEERVVLETEEDSHGVYPDVKITERSGRGFAVGGVASQATVIEILSLANKLAGEGQQQYRRKQKELEKTGVSLVEIDLLRSGRRVLSVLQAHVPPRART